jgi:hypothetical protein
MTMTEVRGTESGVTWKEAVDHALARMEILPEVLRTGALIAIRLAEEKLPELPTPDELDTAIFDFQDSLPWTIEDILESSTPEDRRTADCIRLLATEVLELREVVASTESLLADLDFATSGTYEDGTPFVTPGGPEHLQLIRDRAIGALRTLPLGGAPTKRETAIARTHVALVIIDLESALGVDDEDRYEDDSPVGIVTEVKAVAAKTAKPDPIEVTELREKLRNHADQLREELDCTERMTERLNELQPEH